MLLAVSYLRHVGGFVRSKTFSNCQIWDLLFELSDLEPDVRIVNLGTCFRNVSLEISCQNRQIWDLLFQVSDLETVCQITKLLS